MLHINDKYHYVLHGKIVRTMKRIVKPSAFIAIPLSRKLGKMDVGRKISNQLVTDSSKRLKGKSTNVSNKRTPSPRGDELSLDKALSSGLLTLRITVENDRGKMHSKSSTTRRDGSSKDVATNKMKRLEINEKGREHDDLYTGLDNTSPVRGYKYDLYK